MSEPRTTAQPSAQTGSRRLIGVALSILLGIALAAMDLSPSVRVTALSAVLLVFLLYQFARLCRSAQERTIDRFLVRATLTLWMALSVAVFMIASWSRDANLLAIALASMMLAVAAGVGCFPESYLSTTKRPE